MTNSKAVLVIVHHESYLLFWYFKNPTAYHLGWYEPSSSSTKGFRAITLACILSTYIPNSLLHISQLLSLSLSNSHLGRYTFYLYYVYIQLQCLSHYVIDHISRIHSLCIKHNVSLTELPQSFPPSLSLTIYLSLLNIHSLCLSHYVYDSFNPYTFSVKQNVLVSNKMYLSLKLPPSPPPLCLSSKLTLSGSDLCSFNDFATNTRGQNID